MRLSRKKLQVVFLLGLMASVAGACDRVKEKTKAAINKGGETVGKGSSEFFSGVSEGIDQTFQCKVEVDKQLADKGISHGKFKIGSSKDASNNQLTIYIIFDRDFNNSVTAKVFDKNGQEYGRANTVITGKKGEARYVDLVFDKRTEIETRSSIVLN